MKYLSCADVSKKLNISVRRIQQMCKDGDFSGTVKQGHAQLIPDDNIDGKNSDQKKPLPVGITDFRLVVNDYYYVDKTLMIRDFLDERPMVSLFTRPRRFGKTLNMDMLRTFFEQTSEDTSFYFKDKKIWQCGEKYTCYQGKYPVIFLTFKDVKYGTWDETLLAVRKLISLEYSRHSELEDSLSLNVYEKEQYRRIACENADDVDYQMGLQILSQLLHKHYGEKCVIIIDEYDTPIQQGHICGFYAETIHFMRNFFSGGLKDNPHLAFGFLTGILRVAKESIFSGLNNLKIYSILDEKYSEYFGFTREEVKEILSYYGKEEKYDEVSEWYDGYRFGNTEIFNPWSVINYVTDNCFPKAFWQSTGSNDAIGEIIAEATPEIKENLYNLLCGKKVMTFIDTGVIYPEISNNPYSIYSFLLVAGYLKVMDVYPQNDGNFLCNVAIPNKEIQFVYKKEILNRTHQNNMAVMISQTVFSEDTEKLQSVLEKFMLQSISSLDGANEGFYHGMMLGLCAVVGDRYQIRSNRESGSGRFDLELKPCVKGIPGFLFEFKYTKDEHANLDVLAEKALLQIEEKKYDTEMINSGVLSIRKIGIAFRGKSASLKRA